VLHCREYDLICLHILRKGKTEVTEKRIERTSSRTAAMTCLCRAFSSLESKPHYQSEDHVAVKILPRTIRVLIHIPLFRKCFLRLFVPPGVYEYVIARTRYIDAVFEKALAEQFGQILLFGAGYDTRALRLHARAPHTRIFELDAPHTQQAKIRQFRKCNLSIPSNLVFIAVDFDRESLPRRLDMAGFEKYPRSLFVLEGLVMYLEPGSVRATFKTIRDYAGTGSRIVFDYVRASVLRRENTLYAEAELVRSVAQAGEKWQFGIEPDEIASFTGDHGFIVSDHKCAQELETTYFQKSDGQRVGRVNGTHCIVTAERE